jgi:hypothetical protein
VYRMTQEQQRELAAGLRALADSTRGASASRRVEEAVIGEMSRLKPAPAPVSWGPPSAAPLQRFLPLAAALLLAVGGALWTTQSPALRAPQSIEPAGFIALPEAALLPDIESASIVRVWLPLAALPTYGVAVLPDFEGDSVQAELLIAQDGHPRAIRFVNDSLTNRSTP